MADPPAFWHGAPAPAPRLAATHLGVQAAPGAPGGPAAAVAAVRATGRDRNAERYGLGVSRAGGSKGGKDLGES